MRSYRFHAILAAVGAVGLTFESWLFGPISWIYGYGSGVETIPAHLALVQGDRLFSFWAPFAAGGIDRLAFWGNADPLNLEPLLLTALPVWLANGVHRLLQYWVAIFFAARVAREQLALDDYWAALAGILHACFSYFTFGEMLAFPAVPMLVWLLVRINDSALGLWAAVLSGLAFSSFTTFTHSLPYLAFFGLLWIIFVRRDFSTRMVVVYLLFFLSMAVGDIPQLAAALFNAPLSHRGAFPPEAVTLSLDGLFYRQLQFDYFNQDPVLKIVTRDAPFLVLAVGAVLAWRAQRGDEVIAAVARLFLRLFMVYLLLSQRWAWVGLQNLVGEVLPWVRGIYMGRFFTVPAAFLIGAGVTATLFLGHRELSRCRPARVVVPAATALLVLFMIIRPKIFLLYRTGVDGWGQANYSVSAVEDLKRRQAEPFRVASVLPLQPAYAYAQGLETADGWANLYSRYYREFWLQVLAPLFANLPGAKQIFAPDEGRPQDHYIFLGADLVTPGVGLLPGERPDVAIREGFDVDRRFDLKLLGLLNVRYVLSELPLKGAQLELVHRPEPAPASPHARDWATGWISPPRQPSGDGLVRRTASVWRDLETSVQKRRDGKDVFVYEIKTFVPRFRFASDLVFTTDGQSTLTKLKSLDGSVLAHTAVIEEQDRPAEGLSATPCTLPPRLVQQTSDEVIIATACNAQSLLIAAINWSPYWRASVDGVSIRLIRVNHTHIGISIPAGAHRIRLAYAPPYSPQAWKSRDE